MSLLSRHAWSLATVCCVAIALATPDVPLLGQDSSRSQRISSNAFEHQTLEVTATLDSGVLVTSKGRSGTILVQLMPERARAVAALMEGIANDTPRPAERFADIREASAFKPNKPADGISHSSSMGGI